MSYELKCCPFCGSFASVYYTTYPNGEKAYRICCLHEKSCYLENGIGADFDTEEAAAEAWNRRKDDEGDYF